MDDENLKKMVQEVLFKPAIQKFKERRGYTLNHKALKEQFWTEFQPHVEDTTTRQRWSDKRQAPLRIRPAWQQAHDQNTNKGNNMTLLEKKKMYAAEN